MYVDGEFAFIYEPREETFRSQMTTGDAPSSVGKLCAIGVEGDDGTAEVRQLAYDIGILTFTTSNTGSDRYSFTVEHGVMPKVPSRMAPFMSSRSLHVTGRDWKLRRRIAGCRLISVKCSSYCQRSNSSSIVLVGVKRLQKAQSIVGVSPT